MKVHLSFVGALLSKTIVRPFEGAVFKYLQAAVHSDNGKKNAVVFGIVDSSLSSFGFMALPLFPHPLFFPPLVHKRHRDSLLSF